MHAEDREGCQDLCLVERKGNWLLVRITARCCMNKKRGVTKYATDGGECSVEVMKCGRVNSTAEV